MLSSIARISRSLPKMALTSLIVSVFITSFVVYYTSVSGFFQLSEWPRLR
nr:MAG TPA: hypothetical protein [Microviridae sp.]